MLSQKKTLFYRGNLLLLIILAFSAELPGYAAGQSRYPDILDSLYNLDFDLAETSSLALIDDAPENPDHWNLLASSLWLRILYKQQKMDLEAYSGSKFGTVGSDDSVDIDTEVRFRETLAQAVKASESILVENPDDIGALYSLGVTHGTAASFEALVNKAYSKANKEARKARDYHMNVLELDRSYHDARFTIGMYKYALGSMPGFLRFLLGFIGIGGGDKEGGIKELELVAEAGGRASTNANLMLVVIYNREEQYSQSIEILNDLHSLYPRNFLLELSLGTAHVNRGEWAAASIVYHSVLSKIRNGSDGYNRIEVEPVLYKIGELNIHGSEFEGLSLDKAMDSFETIVSSSSTSDGLKGKSRLWMGKIRDSQGRRDEAIQNYNSVLVLDCDKDLKVEARNHLRRPFKN